MMTADLGERLWRRQLLQLAAGRRRRAHPGAPQPQRGRAAHRRRRRRRSSATTLPGVRRADAELLPRGSGHLVETRGSTSTPGWSTRGSSTPTGSPRCSASSGSRRRRPAAGARGAAAARTATTRADALALAGSPRHSPTSSTTRRSPTARATAGRVPAQPGRPRLRRRRHRRHPDPDRHGATAARAPARRRSAARLLPVRRQRHPRVRRDRDPQPAGGRRRHPRCDGEGMRDVTFNLDSNDFIRITGYLVRKSDLADLPEARRPARQHLPRGRARSSART